jgi:hypothetical protein
MLQYRSIHTTPIIKKARGIGDTVNMDKYDLMQEYAIAYEELYQRQPSELREIDGDILVVNGVRMTVKELDVLTSQLKQEIAKAREAKRSIVKRLLKWFTTAS